MESIIKDHVLNHLSTNNLLSHHQFGFIPGRSCSTQLLLLLDYLTSHLDNGYSIDVIYLDLSCFIPVTSGVPQGSVLDPLLFIIFVNEIPSIVSNPALMCADDTKIFRDIRNGEDYTALQNDFDLLHR